MHYFSFNLAVCPDWLLIAIKIVLGTGYSNEETERGLYIIFTYSSEEFS